MTNKFFTALFLLVSCSTLTFSQKPKRADLKSSVAAAASAKSTNEKQQLEKALVETDSTKKIAALQKFVRDFPKSNDKNRALENLVSARAALADEKLRAGDRAGGVKLFKQAVADAPNPISDKLFAEIIAQFPTNLFYRNEHQAAIEIAEMIEDRIGGNPKQLLGLAPFYLGTENAADARRLAEKAIAIDSAQPAAYQILGLAHRLSFQLEDSANAYAKALELDANSAISKRSLAEMKRATGKTDEAIALYREMLEKNSEDAAAQTGLTLSLFDAEKQPEAETEMAKSLAKNPNNLFLLVGAGYWYAAHLDAAKAVDYARRAVAVEPRYTWARIALARGLLVQGKALEAEKELLAARQYGNFPTLDYEIASARLAAGFYEEAARELRKNFVVRDDSVQTKLGNRVAKQAKTFVELLELERRASIFEPLAADSPENAEKLKSLLRFNQMLASADAKDDEIAQSVGAFVGGDDKAKIHRRIYAASRLLEAKRNLPQVLELTQAAVREVDSALDAPNAAAAILADELIDSRTIAISRNEVVVVPEIPRQTLMSILRGRIEEISGWTLYQQDKPQEAVVRLKRAVSIMPEKSAWWRSSTWKLAAALDAAGKPTEALDIYVKHYTNSQPDYVKYSLIESLYQKVNGTTDGLEAKIGVKPAGSNIVRSMPNGTTAQKTTTAKTDSSADSSAETAATPDVSIQPTAANQPSKTAAQIKNSPVETPVKTISEPKPAASAKPLFEPIIITVPRAETKSPETAKPASTDDSGETRKRRTADQQNAEKAESETAACSLTVNQETVTILSDGGKLGVLLGFEGEGEITKITAASSSPEDVAVTLDANVGRQSNRAFFVIKSISRRKGAFTVTFDSPCGKKEVVVKVR